MYRYIQIFYISSVDVIYRHISSSTPYKVVYLINIAISSYTFYIYRQPNLLYIVIFFLFIVKCLLCILSYCNINSMYLAISSYILYIWIGIHILSIPKYHPSIVNYLLYIVLFRHISFKYRQMQSYFFFDVTRDTIPP